MNEVMSGARSVPPRLDSHARALSGSTLRTLFADDSRRAEQLARTVALQDCELFVDFSKQRITSETLTELIAASREAGFGAWRERMIAGEAINATEGRAVTHIAMRATNETTAPRGLRDEAQQSMGDLREFVKATPASITHVVNLGIGGSDLGPALLCDALAAMRPSQRAVRFASNIDPLDLDRALEGLDAQRTLFVVCSKSFGTLETLANARRALDWLKKGGVADPALHIVAVTSQPQRVSESGLPIGRVLSMPESIGGRFSVSSAVAVSVALAFGSTALDDVRDGMRLMDEHFVTADDTNNVPLLMGLIWWWNTAVLTSHSVAVIPYSRALAMLPAYLQQLIMESNGKSVSLDGKPVATSTPVVWGGVGTNAQHAFFQMLHQGTHEVPCDFIGHSAALGSSAADHDVLVANMIAQSRALAFGVTESEVGGEPWLRVHRATPGNRPSTTLLFSRLTPRALGALIALYEHSTFVQGVMFGINSFDQWGVELGKQLATRVAQDINGTASGSSDASTSQLVERHRRWRNGR